MRDIYALIYVLQRRCTLACSFLVAGMQRSVEGRRIEDLMERSADRDGPRRKLLRSAGRLEERFGSCVCVFSLLHAHRRHATNK
jgi:hypothetical protein